jgi:PAS domain S-box-containing protein
MPETDRSLERDGELFRQMFEGNLAVKLIADPESGLIVHANPAACKFYGYSLSELQGMPISNINMLPKERIKEELERAGAEGGYLFYFRHRLASGEVREVEVHSSPITFQGKNLLFSIIYDITERKRAEEAFKESEEKYRGLVETANVIIVRIDSLGSVTFVNPYAQSFFGYSQEEILGKSVVGTIIPKTDSVGRDLGLMMQDILRHPERYETNENENIRKCGERVWVLWSNRAIMDAQGHLSEMLCIGYDITEKKRAEIDLARANRALRTLTECDKALVLETDETRLLQTICEIIVGVGGYRLAWVGYAEHDEDRSVRPVAHAGVNEGYLEAARISWADTPRGRGATGEAIRKGAPSIHTHLLTDPSFAPWREAALKRGFASAIALPLKAEGKTIGALVVYASEPDAFSQEEAKLLSTLADSLSYGIHSMRMKIERKRAEENARRVEERFRMLMDVMNEGVGIQDERGIITYVNERHARMLGYSRSELIGRPLSSLYAGKGKEALQEQMARRRSGEQTAYEVELLRKDGSKIPVIVSATPLFDDRGEFKGSIGAVTDITVRKRMEEEIKTYADRLEQSNKELEQFASIASHDLQEPLRKITSFGDRLAKSLGSSLTDRARDYLERMMGAAERMQRLIQALLSYSRVSTRAESLSEVDLGSIVYEVLSDIELQVERANAQIAVEELPRLWADPSQMGQLFQNLIGNAIKYNREGYPKVKVYSQLREGRYEILVEDNGIGFDEKHLERIFAPFQRLHGKGEFEGTGMGLAICRKIAERHGGTITARSAPGEGSTFIVTLPVKQKGGGDD